MDWLGKIFQVEVLSLLIPIIFIIGAFVVAAMNAHYKHQERIEKIKQGFNPDE